MTDTCPTCGGRLKVLDGSLPSKGGGVHTGSKTCPDCDGEGTMTAYREEKP